MASRFLYLVRHGEAAEGGSLSDAGQEQARRTGERLKNLPVTRELHQHRPRRARAAATAPRPHRLSGCRAAARAAARPSPPSSATPHPRRPRIRPQARHLPTPGSASRGAGRLRSVTEGAPCWPGRRSSSLRARRGRARLGKNAPGESPAADAHELIVTHNFLIGWFIRHALDAPDWRWIGLNQQNCALTVILYQPGLPPSLVTFNDAAHLPDQLRWTGFPAPAAAPVRLNYFSLTKGRPATGYSPGLPRPPTPG